MSRSRERAESGESSDTMHNASRVTRRALRISSDATRVTRPSPTTPRIWMDLENSPHVPFFIPILEDLERAGCKVIVTARDFAQTRALVQQAALQAPVIGKQFGHSTVTKAISLTLRVAQLVSAMRGQRVSLAIGHGSRGLLFAARLLRIPTLTLYDYEGASVRLFNRVSTYVMTPEAIPFATLESLGLTKEKHLTYPGLKEDVYVSNFEPDDSLLSQLPLDPKRIIVTIRPPSRTAHYRSEESFRLYESLLRLLTAREDVQIVLVPRERTSMELAKRFASNANIIVPNTVVNGLNLLHHSDVLISGGGTMVREAAALGVPAITIFKGTEGAVDRWLIDQGKMTSLEEATEILPFLKKRAPSPLNRTNVARTVIVDAILRLCNYSMSNPAHP